MAPSCVQTVAFLLSPGCDGELLFLAWHTAVGFSVFSYAAKQMGERGNIMR